MASRLRVPAARASIRSCGSNPMRCGRPLSFSPYDSIYAQSLRVEYQAIRDLTDGPKAGSERGLTEHSTLRLTPTLAARDTFAAMRARGEIGVLAFHRVEEALDRADIYAMRYSGDA